MPRAPQAVALPQQQRLHDRLKGIGRVPQRAVRVIRRCDAPEHAREGGGQRGALGAHGLGVGLELAQDGGQLRHVVVGEANAEGAPVEQQTLEGLQHRRVSARAVVLDDHGDAAERDRVEGAHAPTRAARAQAEGRLQSLWW